MIYPCTYVSMYVRMYVCVHVCVCACLCVQPVLLPRARTSSSDFSCSEMRNMRSAWASSSSSSLHCVQLCAVPKAIGRIVFVRASGFTCGSEGGSDGTPAKARATAQESDRTEGLDAGPIRSTQTRVAYSGTLVGTGSIGVRRKQAAPHLYHCSY